MPLVFTQNEVNLSGVEYADVVGEVYEYPARYRNLIRPGEQFVYYRGRRRSVGTGPQVYFGSGIVNKISTVGDLLRCSITNYQAFDRPVPFKDGDHYLEPAANDSTQVGFYFQAGVRHIDQQAFGMICKVGLGESPRAPSYADAVQARQVDELAMTLALAEASRRWPDAEIRRMPHNNPGFDIEILHQTGAIQYIEVKGTRASEPRFFITAGEVAYSHAHPDKFSIWIYHSMNLYSRAAALIEHDGPVAETSFELQPLQYLGRFTGTR
ncbi:MAG: DUF3883 domain-containing protein [Mycobacterium sp.]